MAPPSNMAVPLWRLLARRRRRALLERWLMNAISVVVLVGLAILIVLYW